MVLSQEHCCTIRKSGQDILGTKHPKFLTHPVLAVRKAWMVRPPTLCAKKETSQAKAPSIAEFSFGIRHNLDIIWILYCMNTFMRFMLWPIHCLIKESTFILFHRLLPWWNTKIKYPDLWEKALLGQLKGPIFFSHAFCKQTEFVWSLKHRSRDFYLLYYKVLYFTPLSMFPFSYS